MSPSAALPAICARHRPSHVLTLASPGDPVPTPPCDSERLVLRVHDIAASRPGFLAPDRALLETILAFGRTWPGRWPLVVQCSLGISRSPAAAFAIACALAPDVKEDEIALALRSASPCATPNRLMVAHADAALGRDGRMIAAVEAIGRGADYRPQSGFCLDVPCPAPA